MVILVTYAPHLVEPRVARRQRMRAEYRMLRVASPAQAALVADGRWFRDGRAARRHWYSYFVRLGGVRAYPAPRSVALASIGASPCARSS